jgi:hypothetical protein
MNYAGFGGKFFWLAVSALLGLGVLNAGMSNVA